MYDPLTRFNPSGPLLRASGAARSAALFAVVVLAERVSAATTAVISATSAPLPSRTATAIQNASSLPGPYTPRTVAGVLIVCGLAALVAELKIMSFGLLTTLGIICLGSASWLIWSNQLMLLGIRPEFLIAILFALCMVMVFLVVLASKSQFRAPSTGDSGFIGERATVETPLHPEGTVLFQGAYWKARAASPLPSGTIVKIVRIKGLELFVEALDDSTAISGHGSALSHE